MERYEHKQQSTWMYWVGIVVSAVIMIVSRGAGSDPAFAPTMTLVMVLLAAIILLFSRMTTTVDAGGLSWSMGWGWPSGEIVLAEIASVEITRTNLLEGFGIHWTIWHGWLWNVGGFQAVALTKRDGSRVTLGTDDPEGLYDAIVAHRGSLT